MNAFSFWFVIIGAVLPVSVASYSLVGEKVQRSLEPLLATPTTDGEILVGKAIAAFVPVAASMYIGAVVYMVLMDLFTYGRLGYLYFPNDVIGVGLLPFAPLASLCSIGFSVLVSSRSNDIRAAQQFGMLIVLPFGAIYLLAEIGTLALTLTALLVMSAVLLALDVVLLAIAKATFRRDEILTKWR